jgi:hypothetical protein
MWAGAVRGAPGRREATEEAYVSPILNTEAEDVWDKRLAGPGLA